MSFSPALSPLPEFIHEAFVETVISPDDAVAEPALRKCWVAHSVEERIAPSSAQISLVEFRDVVHGLRTEFSEREFVAETCVVATPADRSNRTGAVGATLVFTALEDGRRVTVSIVAVPRVQ
ncbi:hypothetical protein DFH09DRAFT_1314676 [Mycena vulgaris]|nr:hypothetical protein DFH09DRAFT_1314676 [Mycena vulgaris]